MVHRPGQSCPPGPTRSRTQTRSPVPRGPAWLSAPASVLSTVFGTRKLIPPPTEILDHLERLGMFKGKKKDKQGINMLVDLNIKHKEYFSDNIWWLAILIVV